MSASNGEFIIADTRYGLNYMCICKPSRHYLAAESHNEIFNDLFSSARVIIEHVNGMLKARLVRVIEDVWDSVLSLIIHNLLIDFSEDELEEDIENEDDDNKEVIDFNVVDQPDGIDLRIKDQAELIRWYFNN